jgi:hypothetical protein
MGAKVGVTDVWIGNGSADSWRSIASPASLRPDDIRVKLLLSVGNVRKRYKAVAHALNELQQRGVIERYNLVRGAAPEVICQPGLDIVREIHASRSDTHNYILVLRYELRTLLDAFGAGK